MTMGMMYININADEHYSLSWLILCLMGGSNFSPCEIVRAGSIVTVGGALERLLTSRMCPSGRQRNDIFRLGNATNFISTNLKVIRVYLKVISLLVAQISVFFNNRRIWADKYPNKWDSQPKLSPEPRSLLLECTKILTFWIFFFYL